jgi:hypothetical protein
MQATLILMNTIPYPDKRDLKNKIAICSKMLLREMLVLFRLKAGLVERLMLHKRIGPVNN